jgi:hypothetical protein
VARSARQSRPKAGGGATAPRPDPPRRDPVRRAATRRGPSVRNRRIGTELGNLLEELNLTPRAAGRRLERSPGSLGQIENGYRLRARDLVYILHQYGVEDPLSREASLELARTDRKSGWWHTAGRVVVADRVAAIGGGLDTDGEA